MKKSRVEKLTNFFSKYEIDGSKNSKDYCIDLIKIHLNDVEDYEDGFNPDEDAEKIYQYFIGKGINWLLSEFLWAVLEEDEDRLKGLAAELE